MAAASTCGALSTRAYRVAFVSARGGIGHGSAASAWRVSALSANSRLISIAANAVDTTAVPTAARGGADDDTHRYVYVGNLDFFTPVEAVKAALTDLLQERLVAVEVPGWGEGARSYLPDGTLKPRKKRDEGKHNRGFAVLEFDTPKAGRAAAEALSRDGGALVGGRRVRSSVGVSIKSSSDADEVGLSGCASWGCAS
jgi:hypothetical protein